MAKTVRRIEAKSAVDTARKRVAAYARVSMETDRLEHSLSKQISYYSALSQRHPGLSLIHISSAWSTTAWPST